MPVNPSRALVLAATAFVGAASFAHAQVASDSGAQQAENWTPPPASEHAQTSASTPKTSKGASRRASTDPGMRTGASPTPTGPDTSTVQPDTSDLSGSNGATITQSQGTAPPGVKPPNGSAPDTGGGAGVDNVPNAEGGPH